jgi:hypothetical protein
MHLFRSASIVTARVSNRTLCFRAIRNSNGLSRWRPRLQSAGDCVAVGAHVFFAVGSAVGPAVASSGAAVANDRLYVRPPPPDDRTGIASGSCRCTKP